MENLTEVGLPLMILYMLVRDVLAPLIKKVNGGDSESVSDRLDNIEKDIRMIMDKLIPGAKQ